MSPQDFYSIGIVGVSLSIIVEYIKRRLGPESAASKSMVIMLSGILGCAFYFFNGTPVFLSIVGVLSTASAFYAIFLK